MKRQRVKGHAVAKPLYKTHANFDLSEDSEDEAKAVAAKFSTQQGGPVMFTDLLKKYKKPEEPIIKYLDDFCKYKLYLAYFAQDDTKEPPIICPEGDPPALLNDKQSIAAAFVGYQEFKKRLPKFKEDYAKQIDTPFTGDLKQCKELHVVKSKRQLVLGTGKQMSCASDDILHLFMALHLVLHFESYLAHLLESVWQEKEEEIQGMTFCFIYEMFSPHFHPFRLAFAE